MGHPPEGVQGTNGKQCRRLKSRVSCAYPRPRSIQLSIQNPGDWRLEVHPCGARPIALECATTGITLAPQGRQAVPRGVGIFVLHFTVWFGGAMKRIVAVALGFLVVVAASPAFAQVSATSGSINGKVTDSSGGVLPGVS